MARMLLQILAVLLMLCICGAQKGGKSSDEAKGVLLVDSITLPKLIPLHIDLMVLVVQKKQIGDYGTDSIRADYFNFANFVQLKAKGDEVKPILFAQMIVNGAENLKAAVRLGVKENFLHPALFLIRKGTVDAIPYPTKEPFHQNSLLGFLNKHTDFYYKVQGTNKVFDGLAAEFVAATGDKRAAVLQRAKDSLDKMTKDDLPSALYYVKVMEKMQSIGDKYINTEIQRLENLLDSTKLALTDRANIKNRLNGLKVFRSAREDLPAAENRPSGSGDGSKPAAADTEL